MKYKHVDIYLLRLYGTLISLKGFFNLKHIKNAKNGDGIKNIYCLKIHDISLRDPVLTKTITYMTFS